MNEPINPTLELSKITKEQFKEWMNKIVEITNFTGHDSDTFMNFVPEIGDLKELNGMYETIAMAAVMAKLAGKHVMSVPFGTGFVLGIEFAKYLQSGEVVHELYIKEEKDKNECKSTTCSVHGEQNKLKQQVPN